MVTQDADQKAAHVNCMRMQHAEKPTSQKNVPKVNLEIRNGEPGWTQEGSSHELHENAARRGADEPERLKKQFKNKFRANSENSAKVRKNDFGAGLQAVIYFLPGQWCPRSGNVRPQMQ